MSCVQTYIIRVPIYSAVIKVVGKGAKRERPYSHSPFEKTIFFSLSEMLFKTSACDVFNDSLMLTYQPYCQACC